jgi:beta-ureidopropionase
MPAQALHDVVLDESPVVRGATCMRKERFLPNGERAVGSSEKHGGRGHHRREVDPSEIALAKRERPAGHQHDDERHMRRCHEGCQRQPERVHSGDDTSGRLATIRGEALRGGRHYDDNDAKRPTQQRVDNHQPNANNRQATDESGVQMANIVRAALVQTTWTGDKSSMIEAHVAYAREAASQGAQVMCFQELFYGPYFCQVQDSVYYDYAEEIPDGPTTKRFQVLAKELSMVLILPMYEREQDGVLYNTAAVIDADGTYLGKYRKTHIPQVKGFWEKFYFRPGNLGYPVFDTAVGRIGVYICYDRHFPEGWRALGLAGAKIVFNPSATSRGLSAYLWQLEQPASAVANEYFIGAINRVGIEDLGENDFYGQTYFVNPRGQFVGDVASTDDAELIVRDLDMDLLREVRDQWAFYRDRRPDMYGPLAQA